MAKKILVFLLFAIILLPSLTLAQEKVTLTDPLALKVSGELAVYVLAGRIIKFMLGIVGSLALLMFVIGGAQWMLSGGNQAMVKKGRDTLVWAAIGMAVVIGSYAILTQLLNILIPPTS